MKEFLTENFLLQTDTAASLYHDYASKMPIYDYHNHLPVKEIAENRQFENLTQIWLAGDHYKWRAMRCCGVSEEYITGNASDREKFNAWARTVPKTLRNPLYHWTHMELKRPFGIEGKLLGPDTADGIYDTCNDLLKKSSFSARGILSQMNVKVICTTDDPLDDLGYHKAILKEDSCEFRVLPAFRPDKAMKVDDLSVFNDWVDQLQLLVDEQFNNYEQFIAALENRLDYFHGEGCRISDHALDIVYYTTTSSNELNRIFLKARKQQSLTPDEVAAFKTHTLIELCKLYSSNNWVQQFHIGPIRNNNKRMFLKLGPDTGYDSMGDECYAKPLASFLDHLDQQDRLAKTILYTINPKDNEMLATMIGNFQDGKTPGKIQFGSGWWFNDQKDGMEKQINALSNMGILSQFVGMLTDSRSFLSFPRHEYFRRILCNLFGNDIENGEIPNDLELVGGIIQDICYNNALRYFG